MPYEVSNFSGALGLDFRKWRRHVKTSLSNQEIHSYIRYLANFLTNSCRENLNLVNVYAYAETKCEI